MHALRDCGEGYDTDWVMAQVAGPGASGIEALGRPRRRRRFRIWLTPTRQELVKLDRKRKKKGPPKSGGFLDLDTGSDCRGRELTMVPTSGRTARNELPEVVVLITASRVKARA